MVGRVRRVVAVGMETGVWRRLVAVRQLSGDETLRGFPWAAGCRVRWPAEMGSDGLAGR